LVRPSVAEGNKSTDVVTPVAWFRLLICGENFPNGQSGLVGFYVTRFIDAADEADAKSKALAQLRAEPTLVSLIGKNFPAAAQVFFEDVSEWPAEQVPGVQPGFAFYPIE
jgi:hypothetical protein